jgi:hypothetical protein
MKVVFICIHDWANECYTISKALNQVGVESRTFIKIINPNDYPEHGTGFHKIGMFKKYIEDADVIVYGFSDYFELGFDIPKNTVVGVLHGGSKYRQFADEMNKIFNPIVDITLSGSDMCGLGAKNEVCVFSAVDDEYIQPKYKDFETSRKRVVGHYPSGNKGYDIILPVIEKLRNEIDFIFNYSHSRVKFTNQIYRISECDIYIENIREEQRGIKLTTFGRTALEAAALGKVICTRFLDIDLYKSMFGECPVQVCNTAKELEIKLRYLLTCSPVEFINLQKETRKWIEKYHGLEPMGLKWKEIFVKALKQKRKKIRGEL